MYGVDGKLLNEIKRMHVNSLLCALVEGGESECLIIGSGLRQYCIMSPWLFNV